MKRTALKGNLYPEVKGGLNILQEYRWSCLECSKKSSKRLKLWDVYESKRHGATSGMMKHLSTHQITEGTHAARLRGYTQGEDRET